MAYQYAKLSEVEKIETPVSPNILVEDAGEVVRVPAAKLTTSGAKVQADWNETDESSPAFIMNKPDLGSIGGSGAVADVETVVYYGSSFSIYADESHSQSADFGQIYNDFASGKRVVIARSDCDMYVDVLGAYTNDSGSIYLVMLDRMSLQGGSLELSTVTGSASTNINPVNPSGVSGNTVMYTCSSGASSTNSNLSRDGSFCSQAMASSDIEANKRILVYYPDGSDTLGGRYSTAICGVLGSFANSGQLSLVLVDPGTTSLKTLTFYAG